MGLRNLSTARFSSNRKNVLTESISLIYTEKQSTKRLVSEKALAAGFGDSKRQSAASFARASVGVTEI
jgi:hypothetical protein